MNEPQDTGKTDLVLPIICPKCNNEIDLEMIFSLLPPKPADATLQQLPSEIIPLNEPTEEV